MRMAVKVAIIESGQTQRQVAAQIEMPESRLSAIVRGWINPRTDERKALARVLGRRLEELFAD